MLRRSLRLPTIQASWRTAGAVLTLAAALILGTIPAPALAHHGWSGYDSATLLSLTGTIVDVQYENPQPDAISASACHAARSPPQSTRRSPYAAPAPAATGARPRSPRMSGPSGPSCARMGGSSTPCCTGSRTAR